MIVHSTVSWLLLTGGLERLICFFFLCSFSWLDVLDSLRSLLLFLFGKYALLDSDLLSRVMPLQNLSIKQPDLKAQMLLCKLFSQYGIQYSIHEPRTISFLILNAATAPVIINNSTRRNRKQIHLFRNSRSLVTCGQTLFSLATPRLFDIAPNNR